MNGHSIRGQGEHLDLPTRCFFHSLVANRSALFLGSAVELKLQPHQKLPSGTFTLPPSEAVLDDRLSPGVSNRRQLFDLRHLCRHSASHTSDHVCDVILSRISESGSKDQQYVLLVGPARRCLMSTSSTEIGDNLHVPKCCEEPVIAPNSISACIVYPSQLVTSFCPGPDPIPISSPTVCGDYFSALLEGTVLEYHWSVSNVK